VDQATAEESSGLVVQRHQLFGMTGSRYPALERAQGLAGVCPTSASRPRSRPEDSS
jgi:hypothetical protein